VIEQETVASGIEPSDLRERIQELELRVLRAEERRRALLHIMGDLNESNRRLERQRKAMIHIMGDLRETTQEMERREQELREKQEQLVQAGKLATLGELTTGVAHELNNPLNNIGLFVGNAIDQLELDRPPSESIGHDLHRALEQVRKASEIITHLRTFGRVAVVVERVNVDAVIERALSLVSEQLRLREIEVRRTTCDGGATVRANGIQLEQVFINLLSNARDALADSPRKVLELVTSRVDGRVRTVIRDSGPGIPEGLEQRIFDPFYTTKEVGAGTGLGLSIAYGIIKEHGGEIWVERSSGAGATFVVDLPYAPPE
jgi:C4-dicarboxylate-specific signal transduction histidine kinase